MRPLLLAVSFFLSLPLVAQPVFQIGGSVGFPVSEDFREVWSPGGGLHASVGQRVRPTLYMFLSFSANLFSHDGPVVGDEILIEGGDVEIYGGSLGVRYFNVAQKIGPYVEVSGGLYLSRLGGTSGRSDFVLEEEEEFTPGAAVGVGLSIPVSRRLRLGVGPHYVHIFDSDGSRDYLPVRVTLIVLPRRAGK